MDQLKKTEEITMEVKEEGDIKITVVGDGAVGKTCLLMNFMSGEFTNTYIPTVLEHSRKKLKIENISYNLFLCDTAGQEIYDRLRSLAYPGTDAFVICYAIDSKNSFTNISTKWFPEVQHHCPNTPVVLVATKSDLQSRRISYEDGCNLKKKLKAAAFIECSAKNNKNIYTVFCEAVRAHLNKRNKRTKRKCALI